MLTSEQVIEIAKTLQPRLPELLPTDRANMVQQKLIDLMTQFNQGEDTSQEILDLLDKQPELEAEITIVSETVKSQSSKTFSLLPGTGNPIEYPRYKCPDCGKIWSQIESSDSVPPCPTNPNHAALQLI